MNCLIAQNKLLARDGPPAAEVDAHLAACDRCREYLVRLGQLATDLAALPAPESEAAKLMFLDSLTAAGPVIKSVPVLPAGFDWRTAIRPLTGIAAAAMVGVGIWASVPGKMGVAPEPEFARHELLQKIVRLDTELAKAQSPQERIPKLTDMAAALQAETRGVYIAAPGKDEMRSLAKMFDNVVREGIVKQAGQLSRFTNPAERHAVLAAATGRLQGYENEARELLQSAPPQATESLKKMETAAKDGKAALEKIAKGEGT